MPSVARSGAYYWPEPREVIVIDHTCIFCQIVAGDAESTAIYEDDTVVAFLDINPITPGHTLVVPRADMPALSDVDSRTGAQIFIVAHE
jgi:histidine triad (HIT) family protein